MSNRFNRRRLAQGFTLAAFSSRLPSPVAASAQSEATPSPEAMVWREIAPLASARSGIPRVTLDGKIYICGGLGGDQRVDRYDPKTDSWEQLADLSVGVNHPGVATLDGKVYVA